MIDGLSRFFSFLRRHGFGATIKRICLSLARLRAGNRMVVFFCDPRLLTEPVSESSAEIKIERKSAPADLDEKDLSQIIAVGNSSVVRRQLFERFEKGASLWLIKRKDNLAGFGWTIQGCTMEPHYFPLGSDDVHLFDFFVFPEFRGKRLNVLLVDHILWVLGLEKVSRAFIEVAEWNQPQLSSLSRTPFTRLGRAGKCSVLGTTLVFWKRDRSHGKSLRSLPQEHC